MFALRMKLQTKKHNFKEMCKYSEDYKLVIALLFPAILITTMLEDLNAQEKDTVTFEVNVNYEGITYKWLKNGVEIRSTDRCQARCKQLTHSLSIRNVHFGDSAEYTFMAGSAVTSAKLHVEGKML